jgi:excinuclease UvrABC nuclease subunit
LCYRKLIVAAGAVITQKYSCCFRYDLGRCSSKKVKDIDQSDFAGEIERISNNYVMYSGWFKDEE